MQKLIKAGRLFYGISIAGIGIQQFFYSEFRPVVLPAWPSRIPGLAIWAWLAGAALIAAGAAIVLEKKARVISLILGGVLLLLCCCHIPYEIIVDPYSRHLALWTNALKELALSGGAFVIARTIPAPDLYTQKKSLVIKLLEKIAHVGSIFFSITMISFGIDHLLYTQGISKLVPAWIPDHVFWTYFSAVALIGSGVAIILEIRLRAIGVLLGSVLFLWFAGLHIPRAIADPFVDKGNEITSVFEALAFSGIAFVIAGKDDKRNEYAKH